MVSEVQKMCNEDFGYIIALAFYEHAIEETMQTIEKNIHLPKEKVEELKNIIKGRLKRIKCKGE